MKSLSFLIFFLVLFTQTNAQSISSLSSELYSLQSKCRNAFSNNSSVDDIEDELEDIHRKISYLVDDIEDLDDNDKRSSEYKTLLLDAQELEDFTRDNNCECLHSFKKLMNRLGASTGMLTEKNGVRIMQADLGNFKLFYAYGLQKKLYRVEIEMQYSKNGGYGSASSKFGLANEVETFRLVPKTENWKIKNLYVEVSYDLNYVPEKCGNDFPRY
jgi:hypothetical protein